MKTPSKQDLNTAIAWLRSNEGDNGESARCGAVADWIEHLESERYLRNECKKARVPIRLARIRLARGGTK